MISIKESFGSTPFNFFFDLKNKRVIVTAEKTSVMCHLSVSNEVVSCSFSESGFKPLKINFESRFNAIDKIPGGFKKKDSTSDFDILLSRLIDRCIRPLFPNDFNKNVNLSLQVLSYADYSLEVISVLAASLSLFLFEVIEFPVSLCKISGENINKATKRDSKFKFFSSFSSQPSSSNGLDYLTENTMVDYECFSDLILKNTDSYCNVLDKAFKITCSFAEDMNRLQYKVISEVKNHLNYKINSLHVSSSIGFWARRSAWGMSKGVFNSFFKNEYYSNIQKTNDMCNQDYIYNSYVRDLVTYRFSEYVTRNKKRLDGRSLFDVSSLQISTDIREQSLINELVGKDKNCNFFSRGNTQVVSSICIGDSSNVQWIDSIDGKMPESFIVNYNFLSHLNSNNKKKIGNSRREIGHSELIKKAIKCHLLDRSNVIRVVCDVIGCDGGSSMSSVCGSSILLYQKKLIKNLIAGISIGLVKHEQNRHFIVDLTHLEDEFLSLIDCKVTGTFNSITAIQLDSKKTGLTAKDFNELLKISVVKLNEVLKSMKILLETKVTNTLTQEAAVNFDLEEFSEVSKSNGYKSSNEFLNEKETKNNRSRTFKSHIYDDKNKKNYGKEKLDFSSKTPIKKIFYEVSDSVRLVQSNDLSSYDSDNLSQDNAVSTISSNTSKLKNQKKGSSECAVLNIDTNFLKDVLIRRDIEINWLSKRLGVSFFIKGDSQLLIYAKNEQNLADAVKFIKHLVKN